MTTSIFAPKDAGTLVVPLLDPEIVIATNFAPTYLGGLAIYQRTLARLLAERTGRKGAFFWPNDTPRIQPLNLEPLPWDFSEAIVTGFAKSTRGLWPSFASRPAAHGILDLALRNAWSVPHQWNPRVVHFVGRGWDFFGFAAHSLARRAGALFTVWPASHPGQCGEDRIDLRLYNLADVVFCQSRHEVTHLTAQGLDASKARVCGLPPMCLPDGDGAAMRGRLELGRRPVVLFLGHRTAGKGYLALLKAWSIVLRRIPDAVLLLAGPGEGGDLLHHLPVDSYRDLGVVDERVKADCYAACDVFCLPSAYESFGIVYLEAWSYGKAVICGSAPASRELVEDGKTGLWADHDPETLAGKLVFLLSRPRDAKRMGSAGRERQIQNFTAETMLKNHLEAWQLSAASA